MPISRCLYQIGGIEQVNFDVVLPHLALVVLTDPLGTDDVVLLEGEEVDAEVLGVLETDFDDKVVVGQELGFEVDVFLHLFLLATVLVEHELVHQQLVRPMLVPQAVLGQHTLELRDEVELLVEHNLVGVPQPVLHHRHCLPAEHVVLHQLADALQVGVVAAAQLDLGFGRDLVPTDESALATDLLLEFDSDFVVDLFHDFQLEGSLVRFHLAKHHSSAGHNRVVPCEMDVGLTVYS